VDPGHHVHPLFVAGRLERLAHCLLQGGAWEEVFERAAVDHVRARARLEDHACDGGLALAGGPVAGVGRQLLGRERRGRGAGLLGGGRLGAFLLFLGIGGVVELTIGRARLLHGQDRLEVLARDYVGLLLLLRAVRPARAGRSLGLTLSRSLGFGGRLSFGLWGRCGFLSGGGRLFLRGGRLLLSSGLLLFRGGLLLLGCSLLGRLGLGLRLLLGDRVLLLGSQLVVPVVLGHQASTSIGCGFCAACG
jgi:hypothetical protein